MYFELWILMKVSRISRSCIEGLSFKETKRLTNSLSFIYYRNMKVNLTIAVYVSLFFAFLRV